MNKIVYDYFFVVTFLLMTILLIITPNNNLFPPEHVDENVYKRVVISWNEKGIQAVRDHYLTLEDNKPVIFLYVQKLLQADKTFVYTRVLAYVLIIACSAIIFSMTKRIESFLFILIPLFLNSMWLTVEIIELFFVVLCLKYKRYSGIFVGLAALFRPYAIIYSVALNKRQWVLIGAIGLIYSAVLLYYDMFFLYLWRVIHYVTIEPRYVEVDWLAIIVYVLFLAMGARTKKVFKYGLLGSVPLIARVWGHYFIIPFGIFYLSYLCIKQR